MALSTFTLLGNLPPFIYRKKIFSIFQNWNSVPIKQHPNFPLPLDPGNHCPIFCLCEFDCPRSFIVLIWLFRWKSSGVSFSSLKVTKSIRAPPLWPLLTFCHSTLALSLNTVIFGVRVSTCVWGDNLFHSANVSGVIKYLSLCDYLISFSIM